MGWTPIAEEENFIVVYPEGLNKHWNDGRNARKFAEQDAKTNDVAFVVALLDHLKKEFPKIDPKRVFTTGASNGGFISHRIAIEASDRFAAAGIVCGRGKAFAFPGRHSFEFSNKFAGDPLLEIRIGEIAHQLARNGEGFALDSRAKFLSELVLFLA